MHVILQIRVEWDFQTFLNSKSKYSNSNELNRTQSKHGVVSMCSKRAHFSRHALFTHSRLMDQRYLSGSKNPTRHHAAVRDSAC